MKQRTVIGNDNDVDIDAEDGQKRSEGEERIIEKLTVEPSIGRSLQACAAFHASRLSAVFLACVVLIPGYMSARSVVINVSLNSVY
jgi:hypothetical protein